ncbi:tetratricopeptide repeat protein [Nostoc sp.]|uniref:tetratricopeptide repeat protein n=1 Tax=Nostoc sp. TaxID=1180 RepID=UPI002FF39ACB
MEQKATSAKEVKNYEEAANIWRSLIERDAKNSSAYAKLADILSNQGKIAETIAAYRQLIKIKPEASTYIQLVDILMKQEKPEEAIALYRQAAAKEPTDYYYSNLSQALAQQENLDEVLGICQKKGGKNW